jgi:hypothetical protein
MTSVPGGAENRKRESGTFVLAFGSEKRTVVRFP